MNDSDEYARRFREATQQMATDKEHMWKCVNCGKENQSNRDHCWKCGTNADGTPPENSENFSLADEKSSTSIPAVESRIPPLESRSSKPKPVSIEVRALISRYWDAYVVARATVGLGEIIKTVAAVLAILIVLAALLIAVQIGGGGGFVTFLLGAISAAFVGGQFYLLGLIVMAQGQILKASLDSAVNSSPFLQNEDRAKIMSLK